MSSTRKRSLLALSLLLLALGGGSPAGATFAGSNGSLAYFWSGSIYVMRSDGTGVYTLGAGLSPAWAPNGRRLAFDRQTARNFDIWTTDARGRAARRVTRDPAPDYGAAWSPDATRLAFTRLRGEDEDLYVIRADGRGERRLTTHPAPEWGAAWSPDGARIAFAGNAQGNLEVEVVRADGSGRVALTSDPARDYDPSWSPDGTQIAFTSERDGNGEIYVMNADGTNVRRLTNDPAHDQRPAWSPDGTLIAFESSRDPRAYDRDVFVMNADGTEARRLRTGAENARDVDWQPTVDLAVALEPSRRAPRLVSVVVTNLSPATARRVVVVISSVGRQIKRVAALPPGATREVARTRARRHLVATVSGWHADPDVTNNRADLRP